MALSRILCSKDLSVILTRYNNAGNIGKTIESSSHSLGITKQAKFHVSGIRRYPEAPRLALPSNVSEIFSNETGRFTPERIRDMSTPLMMYGTGSTGGFSGSSTTTTTRKFFGDSHVDSYDCFGAVSLNSSMQTNVPKPFKSTCKSTYLNMPGSQWAQDGKYIAESMRKSHYSVYKDRRGGQNKNLSMMIQNYSTQTKQDNNDNNIEASKLTNVEKLKIAVKDYGSTVFVFHISLSLLSLGCFYTIVSSGLDITSLIEKIPGSSERLQSIMTNSSTFAISYAIHKLFAPVRISITLGATPFIVNYLRRIGILKNSITKT
ncbi:uncharacterized protein LOC122860572 [Aphidius gifuensis]|nr:uncharacterized protein LOC122860572 [Aphidius gifuensis]